MTQVATLPLRLTREQQALLEEPASEQLVRWVVNRFIHIWPSADPDEVASLAWEAMALAAPGYRPGEASFATFARKHVIGHVVDKLKRDVLARAPGLERILRQHGLIRTRQRNERTIAHDQPTEARARMDKRMARVAFELFAASAHTRSPEALLLWNQERQLAIAALHEARAQLAPMEARVIERHYIDQIPLRDVAEELGVSYSTAKRAHRRGRAQLRLGMVTRGVMSFPDIAPM